MNRRPRILHVLVAAALLLATAPLRPRTVLAHCDTMDGPVVTAARQALERGNVDLVLIWVGAEDEAEIRQAFEHARAVRALGPEARDLADRFFFETLVRVHRAGEGEPYTGLKPAGLDLGPAIPAADRALESGTLDPVLDLLTHAVADGVRERFERAVALRRAAQGGGVEAGREAVHAYVEYLHHVEGIYEAAAAGGEGAHHVEPHGHGDGTER